MRNWILATTGASIGLLIGGGLGIAGALALGFDLKGSEGFLMAVFLIALGAPFIGSIFYIIGQKAKR